MGLWGWVRGGWNLGDSMRQMGTGTQASTGVSRRWSCGGVGPRGDPFPSRFELDAFAAPSRQGRAREQISSAFKISQARRDGSLWTVAALVLNEQSLEFPRGAKAGRGGGMLLNKLPCPPSSPPFSGEGQASFSCPPTSLTSSPHWFSSE